MFVCEENVFLLCVGNQQKTITRAVLLRKGECVQNKIVQMDMTSTNKTINLLFLFDDYNNKSNQNDQRPLYSHTITHFKKENSDHFNLFFKMTCHSNIVIFDFYCFDSMAYQEKLNNIVHMSSVKIDIRRDIQQIKFDLKKPLYNHIQTRKIFERNILNSIPAFSKINFYCNQSWWKTFLFDFADHCIPFRDSKKETVKYFAADNEIWKKKVYMFNAYIGMEKVSIREKIKLTNHMLSYFKGVKIYCSEVHRQIYCLIHDTWYYFEDGHYRFKINYFYKGLIYTDAVKLISVMNNDCLLISSQEDRPIIMTESNTRRTIRELTWMTNGRYSRISNVFPLFKDNRFYYFNFNEVPNFIKEDIELDVFDFDEQQNIRVHNTKEIPIKDSSYCLKSSLYSTFSYMEALPKINQFKEIQIEPALSSLSSIVTDEDLSPSDLNVVKYLNTNKNIKKMDSMFFNSQEIEQIFSDENLKYLQFYNRMTNQNQIQGTFQKPPPAPKLQILPKMNTKYYEMFMKSPMIQGFLKNAKKQNELQETSTQPIEINDYQNEIDDDQNDETSKVKEMCSSLTSSIDSNGEGFVFFYNNKLITGNANQKSDLVEIGQCVKQMFSKHQPIDISNKQNISKIHKIHKLKNISKK